MSKAGEAPERGDIIVLQFNSQAGYEQANRRPAVVISDKRYNAKTSLAAVCPITTEDKGYPFQVALPEGMRTTGFVLADHVKSLDWRARNARRIETVDAATLEDILAKLLVLIDP